MGRDVEGDFVGVGNPVEIAPDFATEKGGGLLFFRERTERGDGGGEDGKVGGVFVGGIVSVDGVGRSLLEEGGELVAEVALTGGAFEVAGGMTELVLGGIVSEVGGLVLLAMAQVFHGGIAVIGEGAGAGRAAAVGAGDAGEPVTRFLVATDDAVIGHKLEVVLMGTNGEVSSAGECFGKGAAVGDVRRHKGRGWQGVAKFL